MLSKTPLREKALALKTPSLRRPRSQFRPGEANRQKKKIGRVPPCQKTHWAALRCRFFGTPPGISNATRRRQSRIDVREGSAQGSHAGCPGNENVFKLVSMSRRAKNAPPKNVACRNFAHGCFPTPRGIKKKHSARMRSPWRAGLFYSFPLGLPPTFMLG